MNRFVKVTVLTLAALATVATSIQIADAGERYWREDRPWRKSRVVIDVAPRVVVSRPRVIYRENPRIVIDQGAVYDDDSVYADPDQDYGRQVYRDEAPDDENYAAPRRAYDDEEDQAYDNRPATEDDYFPERPQSYAERNSDDGIRKQPAIESAPRRQIRKNKTADQANASGLRPWTKEWRDYCASRFSSFNPENGTYLGYDQKRRFCKAG
ncbi:BA14K family protein [Rhizobium sp.]